MQITAFRYCDYGAKNAQKASVNRINNPSPANKYGLLRTAGVERDSAFLPKNHTFGPRWTTFRFSEKWSSNPFNVDNTYYHPNTSLTLVRLD